MNRTAKLKERLGHLFGFTQAQVQEILDISQTREFSVGELAVRYSTTVHVINHVLKEIDNGSV